jgi:tetratricopeptide (TPR) repeat protein
VKNFYKYFEKLTVPLGYLMGVIGVVALFRSDVMLNWLIIVLICGFTIGTTAIITIIDMVRKKQIHRLASDNNIVAERLKDSITVWYNDEKYGEVVTFGKALGRALYISACYETRIKIGELIKQAAEKQNDELLLTTVLLDDLGWTKVLQGKADAEKDIEQAIGLAKRNGYYREESKGYRHLMAIELAKWNNPELAHEYLDQAYGAYNNMAEGRDKETVFAGLLFASSELAFKENDYDLAMQKAKISEEKRKALGEVDRHMRYYAQAGKIELFRPTGDLGTAKDFFLQGIDHSENANRIDELVKNTYGYSICLIKLGQAKKAREKVDKILNLYGEISLYSEDALLRNEYNKLQTTQEDNHGVR